MKVKATKTGYINHRRQKSDSIFELTDRYEVDEQTGEKKLVATADAQFSPKWMKKVETKKYVEVDADTDPNDVEDHDDDGHDHGPVKGKPGRPKKKVEATGNKEVI